jgi:uncharacterized protein (DUF885 family)
MPSLPTHAPRRRLWHWLLGLLLLLLLALAGASMWFWFTPVGVNNYVNKVTVQLALRSPERLSQLGLIDNTWLDFHSDKLDDVSKAHERRVLAELKAARDELNRYGPQGLAGQELITWKTTAWFFDDLIRQAEFEHGGYRISPISGPTVSTPQFLTDTHIVKDRRSAERYITRLGEFGRVLRQMHERIQDDQAHGVTPPSFIIDQILVGLRAFSGGGAASNVLVTSLAPKLQKVNGLSDAERTELMQRAQAQVATQVLPGYEALIKLYEAMRQGATSDAGIWRLPQGERIYQAELASSTSTALTADEIHALGLSEVARIEADMIAILEARRIGTPGTPVGQRLQVLNADPAQIFPNTLEGRAQLLKHLEGIHAKVMAQAPRFFALIPPQPLEIVRVPPYAENASPGGYYNQPALDGSRPGRFYINLKDTADQPKWTLPTLMVHEGAPGHHFQLSAAQLMTGVPILRKVVPFGAYAEGWALYAERMAKTDMRLYDTDPLGDLGRLQAEMFRATRLVVDTGLHAKRWSREQAIDYMLEKTGMTRADVTREVERYVVWPGQATSYKVGQLAILKLRQQAEQQLGARFDLKGFHEVILMNGSMPLGVLDEVVQEWIALQKRK